MNQQVNQNHHLLILFLNDSQLHLPVNLTENVYIVGRHSSCSIKLNSQAVSRHHATLIKKELPTGDCFYILNDGDLEGKKSQNGTLVNGKKITNHQLEDGDEIVFGNTDNRAIYRRNRKIDELSKPTEDNSLSHDSLDKINKITRPSSESNRERLQDTLIILEEQLKDNLEHKNIQHLASFPELSPNPIIEFDFNGKLTYSNPAADLSFQEIFQQDNQDNPLLEGLTANHGQLNGELLIREVEFQDNYYEQYVHYLSKEKVIRSYIFDITIRKQTEAKLQYQAFHDSVTDIPNREFFYFQLKKYLEKSKETKEPLAILFIDIDRFKKVNDNLSHGIGDILLKNFANRLISSIPSHYFFARWGGDEFILMAPLNSDLFNVNSLDNLDFPTPKSIADKIITSLQEPFVIDEHQVYVSCSIGIAMYPDDGLDEKQLIKNADIALFRAKHRGRNNCQFYMTTLNREQRLLFELENSLYNALNNNELFLTFQPQLDLRSNTITGVEVLLRWRRPQLGLISPSKFIPIAEETGLIASIGKWVLETACHQAKQWQDMGYPALKLAVNVSAKQFQTENFVADVKQILHETQFAPENLELEITESLLMEDVERSELIINQLSHMGIHFSLDDFGTGYSSLSYLKKFPFHFVKIDKSFVDDLAYNLQDKALVSAVITIAKSYDMMVIAEGVETEHQRKMLEHLDCDIIQGWLFSKALVEKDLLAFLDQHRDNHSSS